MKVRRIDFSADEWLAGTGELSAIDRGVYITVCALIYSRGGPIEMEVIRRHIPEHGGRINASLARLETLGKIIRNGSEIDQKRCENELESARKRSEKASENGRVGNEIKALKHATRTGVAPAAPHANHQLPTTNYQKNPPTPLGRGANGKANRRANGTNPRAAKWAHLDELTEHQLGARLNLKTIPRDERDEIKRRLGYSPSIQP